MNIIDIVIILLLALGAYAGFRRGLVLELINLIGVGIGLYLSLNFYKIVGQWFVHRFQTTQSISSIASFLVILLVFNFVWTILSSLIKSRIPDKFNNHIVNKIGGIATGVMYHVVILSVIASFLLLFPVPQVQVHISNSKLIKPLAQVTQRYISPFSGAFNDVIKSVEDAYVGTPVIGEVTKLNLPYTKLEVDESAEQELFALVNKERAQRGLSILKFNTDLQKVAREHATDMWKRQYFSHTNPDGESPFDRLARYKITYVTAGENLALAPSTSLAHDGLMKSPGHRENILYKSYGEVGIGAVSGGPLRGLMFVQVFRN